MDEIDFEEESVGTIKERRLVIEKNNKKTKFTFDKIQYKNPDQWDVKNKPFFESEVLVEEEEYEPKPLEKGKTDINYDSEMNVADTD